MPYGETDWYGAPVTTEGLLRDINRRQSSTQLLVGEGDFNLQVEVPWSIETPLPSEWVLGATDDRIVSGAASRELASRIPGALLHMFEGYSHGAIDEAPDFHEWVVDFFR